MRPPARGTFLQFAQLQLRELWREPLGVFFGLVFPSFFLIFFGLTGGDNGYIYHVATVTNDVTAGKRLDNALVALKSVTVDSMSMDAAQDALLKNNVSAIYQISRNRPNQVTIIATPSQKNFAAVILRAARDVSSGGNTPGFNVQVFRRVGASTLAFAFPGILALALLQLGIFSTAIPLLRARDKGVLLHLSLTPLPRHIIVMASIGVRLIVAATQIAIICGIAFFGFHMQIVQNPALFAGILILGTTMMISMGYALAGLARTYDSGLLAIMVTNFGLMFLGQVFFDSSSSPIFLAIAKMIPLTYVSDSLRSLTVGVPGILPLWVNITMMFVWLAIALLVATRAFRFDLAKR